MHILNGDLFIFTKCRLNFSHLNPALLRVYADPDNQGHILMRPAVNKKFCVRVFGAWVCGGRRSFAWLSREVFGSAGNSSSLMLQRGPF